MCKLFLKVCTPCGCVLYKFEPCPRGSSLCNSLEEPIRRRLDRTCGQCQRVISDTPRPLLHKGWLAEIAEQHDQFRGLDKSSVFSIKLNSLTAWIREPKHPLPGLEKPDTSSEVDFGPELRDHYNDPGRTIEQCRKERQANPPEPGLDYGQWFKITPAPESPPPESQLQTRTKTRRVSYWEGRDYDLTERNTVLTQSQRNTLDAIGHRGIKFINVISRRKLNVTRHKLSANQRGALYQAGHKNLERISVVTHRQDDHPQDSSNGAEEEDTTTIVRRRRPLTAEQRRALREAGHGYLYSLLVKGRHPKTPSN